MTFYTRTATLYDPSGRNLVLTDGDKRCGCGAGCATYGICLRGKRIGLGDVKGRNAPHDRELREYREARAQGIQPVSTRLADVREAVAVSDRAGRAAKPWSGSLA